MFSLRAQGRPARRPPSVRLGLESLEARDCPSAFGTQPGQQLWYLLNTSPVIPISSGLKPASEMGGGNNLGPGGSAYSGPEISLNITYNSQRSITLSGSVTDCYCSTAGMTVTFTGKVSATVTTDANGNFSLTTNASGLGVISATTIDSLGYISNTASVTVTSNAPVISNFSFVEGNDYMCTFSGTVIDQSPAGETVSFGGVPSLTGQTATVAANGTFSLMLPLNNDGSDNGIAWAQTYNWWGLQSNQPTVNVYVSG